MSTYCTTCANCQISADNCVDAWIDDGYCDDHNNKPACQWDGRDCCGVTNPNTKKNLYCNTCTECESSGCIGDWIGDGYCDDNNNKIACNFDDGDCCSSNNNDWNKYCIECNCLQTTSSTTTSTTTTTTTTTTTACEDKETKRKCKKWKKKGKCSNNATAMKCKKTCGEC